MTEEPASPFLNPLVERTERTEWAIRLACDTTWAVRGEVEGYASERLARRMADAFNAEVVKRTVVTQVTYTGPWEPA